MSQLLSISVYDDTPICFFFVCSTGFIVTVTLSFVFLFLPKNTLPSFYQSAMTVLTMVVIYKVFWQMFLSVINNTFVFFALKQNMIFIPEALVIPHKRHIFYSFPDLHIFRLLETTESLIDTSQAESFLLASLWLRVSAIWWYRISDPTPMYDQPHSSDICCKYVIHMHNIWFSRVTYTKRPISIWWLELEYRVIAVLWASVSCDSEHLALLLIASIWGKAVRPSDTSWSRFLSGEVKSISADEFVLHQIYPCQTVYSELR